MKGFYLCILFAFSVCFQVKSQPAVIKSLINAWEVSDTNQSYEAEKTYTQLKVNKTRTSLSQHLRVIKELYVYLNNYPDNRLEVRIAMYEVLGKLEYNLKIVKQDSLKIYNCIKLAHKLKDDQLKAEVYTLFGEIERGSANFILYNLKAVELQRKIGFEYFKYVHNRFFNASVGLYQSNDYRKSIDYGLQCLALKNVKRETWDPRVYIFQLDIVGAAYLKLNQYDSARYYYQQLIDTLIKKPNLDKNVQQLWMGIAKGNIGYTYILQGNEKDGVPLVQLQLTSASKFGSYNNMSISQNILAGIDFKHQRYIAALTKWKEAYQWAFKSEFYVVEQQLLALQGITKTYQKLNRLDSAYTYSERYYQLSKARIVDLNSKKLSAIKAQIAFDDAQINLEQATIKLQEEKTVRNLILIGVFLLMVIALLIYNRNSIRTKYLSEQQLRKQQETEKQMLDARAQVIAFSKNILEKDRLIYSLNKALKSHSTGITTTLLNYVLVTDKEWIKFKEMVANAYPGFFVRLESIIEHITPAEERLASLICLQLSDRQMASMLGISKESVTRSKRRLKQRITIPEGQTLESYICSLNS